MAVVRLRASTFLLCALTVLSAARGQAQSADSYFQRSGLHVTPFAGMYVPIGALGHTALGAHEASTLERQVSTMVVGARFGWRSRQRIGIEGNIAYSPSPVAVTDTTMTQDFGACVLLTDVRAIFTLHAPRQEVKGWSAHAFAGIGMVTRLGDVWRGRPDTTLPALLLGAEARMHTPHHRIDFVFGIQDYVSSMATKQSSALASRQRAPHHDTAWTVGFGIPVGGP